MIGFSSISLFSHPLDFNSIHVVDQDIVAFSILPHLNLTMHDDFNFAYNQVTPDDDEMDNDDHILIII